MKFVIQPQWKSAKNFLPGEVDNILDQTMANITTMEQKLKVVRKYKENGLGWWDIGFFAKFINFFPKKKSLQIFKIKL